MAFYVRQIKPYICIPMAQGTVDELIAVDGYDWVHEDLEEDLRTNIKTEDCYSELIFKERFVRVDTL